MRTLKFSFFLLYYFLFLFDSTAQGYSIKGKFKGLHDTVCYLGFYYGEMPRIMDSTRMDKNGNFAFKGNKKLDGGIYLIIPPGKKKWFEIIVDKEQDFYVETDTTSKMVEHVKVKGSEDNILFYKYWNFISREQSNAEFFTKRIAKIKGDSLIPAAAKKDSIKILQDKISRVGKEVEKYKADFIKTHPAAFLAVIFNAQTEVVIPEMPLLANGKKDSLFPYLYYKAHYWDNIPLNDDRLLRTPAVLFHNKLQYYLDKMVVHHPDSIIKEIDMLVGKTGTNKEMFKYIVWYTTGKYEADSIMGMDAIFVDLVNKYYKTWKAPWVDSTMNLRMIHKAETLEPLLLGKSAPPLVMQDTLDKYISLYEVQSKYTVVVFWDPDCGYCQKIIPKLNEVYQRSLKAKGVTVYSVNIEDDEAKWKKFIVEKKMNWLNVRDKDKKYYLHEMYDIYSTPVIYLLDENKKIQAKRMDVEQLDGFIDYLENKKVVVKKEK